MSTAKAPRQSDTCTHGTAVESKGPQEPGGCVFSAEVCSLLVPMLVPMSLCTERA